MEMDIGGRVFDNWTIKRLIGEGSYGKVYEIERENFGIYRAALKVITVPQSEAELKNAYEEGMDEKSVHNYFYSVVEDIVREFILMSKLKGTTNVVSYEDHEVIPHKDGVGWDILIRMELLTPLLTYAYEHPFSRRDIIRLGVDICRALELCQKYNIIHRDIKPENIFVSDAGDFKLGDFGIARTVEKTMSGLSKKGTYSYMAPEVYRGGAYGFDVDLYSLGIVMYRLLNNNRIPFLPPAPAPITYSEREAALAKRMGGETPPAPLNGLGRLGEIVLKACAFDPKERHASPMQMRQELEAIQYDAADAAIIYPSGDELVLHENQYVSRRRAAERAPQEQTEGGTQSIFGDGAPEGTSKTESVFSQSIPLNVADSDRTESVFGTVAGPDAQRKKAPKREQTGREKPAAKKGVWIAVLCAAVLCAVIGGLAVFRGTLLSLQLDADELTMERTASQSVGVRVNRLLAGGPYEMLQVSVGSPEIASATYDAAQGTLTIEAIRAGNTEITVSDETGEHTDTCYISVEPRIFQVGGQSISEEDEIVRFVSCEIDSLQPLLEMPNLREVEFHGSWADDFELLGQIETLERITLNGIDVAELDVASLPADVEIASNMPVFFYETLGYGERLSLREIELPFDTGQRAVTWESGDPEAAWIDEEAQAVVAGAVKRNLGNGYDSVIITGHIENMDVDLDLEVQVGDGIDYQIQTESGNFQITSASSTSGVSKIVPGVEDCYGFDFEYRYEIESGSFGNGLSLYISQDGRQWRQVYTSAAEENKSTIIEIRFNEPTDFQYYTTMPSFSGPLSDGSAIRTIEILTALYFASVENTP